MDGLKTLQQNKKSKSTSIKKQLQIKHIKPSNSEGFFVELN